MKRRPRGRYNRGVALQLLPALLTRQARHRRRRANGHRPDDVAGSRHGVVPITAAFAGGRGPPFLSHGTPKEPNVKKDTATQQKKIQALYRPLR
jgi:hypothetical protein